MSEKKNSLQLVNEWLDLSATQFPNHFELLGLPPEIDDPATIQLSVEAAYKKVRIYERTDNGEFAKKLLSRIVTAGSVLSDKKKRAAYVSTLKSRSAQSEIGDSSSDSSPETAVPPKDKRISQLEKPPRKNQPERPGTADKSGEITTGDSNNSNALNKTTDTETTDAETVSPATEKPNRFARIPRIPKLNRYALIGIGLLAVLISAWYLIPAVHEDQQKCLVWVDGVFEYGSRSEIEGLFLCVVDTKGTNSPMDDTIAEVIPMKKYANQQEMRTLCKMTQIAGVSCSSDRDIQSGEPVVPPNKAGELTFFNVYQTSLGTQVEEHTSSLDFSPRFRIR